MLKKTTKTLVAYRDRINIFKKLGYDIPKARDFIIKKASLSEGSLIDVATGSGHMAIALARKGMKCIAIDADKEAIKRASLNLKALGLSRFVKLRLADAGKTPFKNDSFDCVVSVNFIHHAKYPRKCVKEMARIAQFKLVIADFNKRGAMIADKVHKSEGNTHERSIISMDDVKKQLLGLRMEVRVFRDKCQTVIVAIKKEEA